MRNEMNDMIWVPSILSYVDDCITALRYYLDMNTKRDGMRVRFQTPTWWFTRLTCCTRLLLHGWIVPMSTFLEGTIVCPPHRALILVWRAKSTLFDLPCPYRAQVNESSSSMSSSETNQLSPNLDNGAQCLGIFYMSFIGFTFPTPLKALVVSHPVTTAGNLW